MGLFDNPLIVFMWATPAAVAVIIILCVWYHTSGIRCKKFFPTCPTSTQVRKLTFAALSGTRWIDGSLAILRHFQQHFGYIKTMSG